MALALFGTVPLWLNCLGHKKKDEFSCILIGTSALLTLSQFICIYICILYYISITSLLQDSVRAFEHPGFVIRLILDNDTIKFEPDFDDYIAILLNVYDVMIKAVSFVPRVETKLYSKSVSNKDILIASICVMVFASNNFF